VVRSRGFEESNGARHLRSPRDHVAGDLEIQALSSASSSRSDPQSDGRQESAAGGVERIKAGGRAEVFFSQAASYLSVEGGGMQGKVELAEALGTTGIV
jgi:hypothetical protein